MESAYTFNYGIAMKQYFCIFLLLLSTSSYSQTVEEFRAVKITNVDSDILFDDQRIAEGMDYLASIGMNTILTVVWNGHGADGVYTLYPSGVMDSLFGKAMYPLFASVRDPLKRVIIEAHRNGMEVMPWFEMGFSPSYSQNGGYILNKFPQWALNDNAGRLAVKNGFDWMSAINPEVQQFIISLVTEIIDNYDVDGIEFSDRIPAMPVEGGYDSVTVSIYKNEHDGASPPQNYQNESWKRWRADKLTAFYKNARDSIKSRSENLIVSSSPSVYPWSYHEYLQDSKTWVDSDIVDNIIPQVYRYSYTSYVEELNKSLSYVPSSKREIFFSGMLIYLRGENYLITPDFLLRSIQANRDRQVYGEAFFFYEGLRLNRDQLGDTLKTIFYSQPALLPHRNGNIWRPRATIVNEDDTGAVISGNWETSSISGFKPNILIKKDTAYASITYYFDVPFDAWFDVFAYLVTGPSATDKAPYTIYSDYDSLILYLNQKNYYNRGWQMVKPVFLTKGYQKVLKLDNRDVPAGQYVVADAAMIMINRKFSPDVIVSSIQLEPEQTFIKPSTFNLSQNYPNPFNTTTKISFSISKTSWITLKVYDVIGREIYKLINEYKTPGSYEMIFDAGGLASGIYFYCLTAGNHSITKKFALIK